MGDALAAALVPVLVLLPGYALLPASAPRRLRLPLVLFTSLLVTSILSLLLMAVGQFNVITIAVLEAPLLLVRLGGRSWPIVPIRIHAVVLAMWAAVAVFAILDAGEPYDATGDAGVYTLAARHVADSGRWTWRLAELVPAGIPEELVVSTTAYVRPWREIAPGFIVRGEWVVPQFFPLYAVWGAVFHPWVGLHGVLAANVYAVLLLLLGWDGLMRLFLGPRWRIAGLAAIVFNPVFLVFVGYPSAETFLAGLLAGWLYWMVLFLRAPSPARGVQPAALLALAVLTKFFAWAVAGTTALALLLLPWRHVRSALVFVGLLGPAAAVGWVLAAPHLENHLGQLLILSGFKIVLAVCAALLALRLVWSRAARVVPRLFGTISLAAVVWLWLEGGPVRDLAALSGPLVVAGLAVGACAFLWRRLELWMVFPAFCVMLLSLYLFLGSGDSPYYPFAARRFLPLTVPGSALFLVWLARAASRTLRRRWRAPRPAVSVVVAMLLVAAVLPAAVRQRSAIVVRHGDGFLDTLAELERAIPDNAVVLATGNGWRYAPYFLLDGEPVYCLDLRRRGILAELDELLEADPKVLVLTDEPRDAGVVATIEERRQLIATTTTPPLEPALPRGSTFRLFVAASVRPAGPRSVDVGSDDQLVVAGCYRAERSDGRSFRWTGRSARVLVGPARRVRFQWSPGSHPTRPLPVSVLADGRQIGFVRLDRGWHTSRWFRLPSSDRSTIVELRTPTFQPAAIGRGHDRRDLGLRLDAVEVQ